MQSNLLKVLKKRFLTINLQGEVDQIVAMIFRTVEPQNIQLLFLQRAYSQKDYYSGDVCLPGGHIQKGQSCIDTAIRQTLQQTSLQLTKQMYIGALQFTLTTKIGTSMARKQANGPVQLLMGVLMFEIDNLKSQNIILQPKEIRSYKWVNIKQFFQGDTSKFDRWNLQRHPLLSKKALLRFPAYRIGMDRHLWGLTLITLTLFVDTVIKVSRQQQNLKIKYNKQFYQRLCIHCTDLLVQADIETQKLARKLYVEDRIKSLKSKL